MKFNEILKIFTAVPTINFTYVVESKFKSLLKLFHFFIYCIFLVIIIYYCRLDATHCLFLTLECEE